MPQRERIAAVAVGQLGDEQVVADQQRLLHRARGDVERLIEEDADDHRQDQGLDDDLDRFAPTAVLRASRHSFPSSCSLLTPDNAATSRACVTASARYSHLPLSAAIGGPLRGYAGAASAFESRVEFGRQTRDDDDGLRQREIVGQCQVDAGLEPGGRDASQLFGRAPGQHQVGRPDGRLTTPMSRQNTPRRIPVPSALAQASLAANRLA